MTPEVIIVSPDTTIAEALRLTREHRIRHLPVMESGLLAGLVTDRDLRLAMPPIWAAEHDELKQALQTRTVGEVMTAKVITAPPEMPVEEAARLMYENRIGCLPVLDGAKVVGILTETDLLRALVELFGAGTPSSRLEVRMPNKPGELARVVRMIGIEHKVNITGLIVPPSGGGEFSLAIMHLQTLNPQPLVASLRKLGYRVGWPALDLDSPGLDEYPARYAEDHPDRVPIEL